MLKRSIGFAVGMAFVLTSCGTTVSPGATNTNNVQVMLTDNTIISSATTFSQNVIYHFTVTNNDTQAHAFAIMPPVASNHVDTAIMQDMAVARIDTINPGETKTLDVTFQQAEPPGSMEFASHLIGQYEAGMHVGITVT
jgi:uncharacterized cupredoxin-like copper-binding protein